MIPFGVVPEDVLGLLGVLFQSAHLPRQTHHHGGVPAELRTAPLRSPSAVWQLRRRSRIPAPSLKAKKKGMRTFLTTGSTQGFALSSRYAPIPWQQGCQLDEALNSQDLAGQGGRRASIPGRPYRGLCRPCRPSSDQREGLPGPEGPPRRGSLLLMRAPCGLRFSGVGRGRKMTRGRFWDDETDWTTFFM